MRLSGSVSITLARFVLLSSIIISLLALFMSSFHGSAKLGNTVANALFLLIVSFGDANVSPVKQTVLAPVIPKFASAALRS